ncbi:MAG: SOS response-associated peptidase [Saprospiraceae bacterium]|nr:SOS response-associated peptidase [Saprospiraceae bacterium]
MCGRYSFAPKPGQKKSLENKVVLPPALILNYNIAPTHRAYVVANDQPDRLQQMEWGLVPHWSADGKNTGRLINARAEGIEEKPSFRDPIQFRRCIVPADSFYEWRKLPGGRKAPYRISAKNEELLYLAGIWDEWGEGDARKRTFAIITTTPNLEMSDLHDRMPVVLSDAAAHNKWVSKIPLEPVMALLHPPDDGLLQLYRVSEKLNRPDYDREDLHTPAREEWTLF